MLQPFVRSSRHVFAFLSMLFAMLVLVAPGCGRSSLEPESLDASIDSGTCGPSTCPAGCCDANGECRTGQDTRFCGSGGFACADCVAIGFDSCGSSKVCGRTVTSCSPSECPSGCCATEGGRLRCLSGTAANACGRGGSACVDCQAQGRACDTVSRQCGRGKCDATNCDGCCVGDQCLTGRDLTACGAKGSQCATCAAGQICRGQVAGGGVCEGTASCGPQNCAGCCAANGQCVTGADANACGRQGGACQNCAGSGRICGTDRTCQTPTTCNAQNCAGCCVGNNCVIATTPQACGGGGVACKACGANETCSNGQCVPAAQCSAANCPGCCIGNICALGNQNTACGLNGAECSNCSAQARVCQGGSCQQPVCGPANCAGCCAGNTCVVGTQDNACGPTNGAQCSDCTATNQVCQGRACRDKCGPANCGAGCCTANNACVPGFANNACGSGGAACSNCTAANSTCNGLVDPRVCNNQQNTCPAPYAACPGGTTTAVTPSLQNLCADADLDALQAACAGGPDTASCTAALQVIAQLNAACAACVQPFAVPFLELRGIYLCTAPQVSTGCRASTGCATDCIEKSCSLCPAGSADQCRNQVGAGGGQCAPFVQQTACVTAALGNGQLCSPQTYQGNFGRWLRAVGDAFCGNGP